MWDRRYRQCVPDPRPRCAAGELSQCVTVGEHFAGEGDHAQATIYQRKACGGGELSGCVALGYMAHRGQGRRMNPEAARVLFERACQGGHAAGCTGLAEVSLAQGEAADAAQAQMAASCERGEPRGCALSALLMLDAGAEVSPERIAQLEEGCAAGHDITCTALGRALVVVGGAGARERAQELHARACRAGEVIGCLHQGELLAEAPEASEAARARGPLQRACAGRVGRACARLGEMFATGQGGVQDGSRAREHHRQACELGIQPSCLQFGEMTMAASEEERDAGAARAAYERGCAQGSGLMCLQFARMLLDAEGGSREAERARRVLKPACDDGEAAACKLLADAYGWEASRAGGVSARKGYAFAVGLLTRGCALRDAESCTTVGLMHMAGGAGVRRDFGVAGRAFERGCELGDAESCLYAGRQALFGHGRERDGTAAEALLQKACSMGAMDACGEPGSLPAGLLYALPYAPGAPLPPRHRDGSAEAPRARRQDSERAPARARGSLPDAHDAEDVPRGGWPEGGAQTAGLGTAVRVALVDGDGHQASAVVLEQSLDVGAGFGLRLALPFAAGHHGYLLEPGADHELSDFRFGNAWIGLSRRQGGGDSLATLTIGAVLPTAVGTRADGDVAAALREVETPQLARPTLGMASGAWGLREHWLWAWDAAGVSAELDYRGREGELRWAFELGLGALAPVRVRDNAELMMDVYGELGIAAGPVVLAMGAGAAFLDAGEDGVVTLEPNLQHVTSGGQRIFLKVVLSLTGESPTPETPTPDWGLQFGARF